MENNIRSIMEYLCDTLAFEKITFSKAIGAGSEGIMKETAVPFRKRGEGYIQIESFCTDGKALHRNLPASECAEILCGMAEHGYRQTDIHTADGDCEIRFSKKSQCHILNRIRVRDTGNIVLKGHDRRRRYLLETEDGNAPEFLYHLGITDEHGRIFDKKRPKYRQINRFLELVDDIYSELPSEGTLIVCDLCCGKSYLTFAVYYYFTVLKKREIVMYGIDRKPDVIAYCNETAAAVGFDRNLMFLCGDINRYEPEQHPDLVLSLHACDIATDIVLKNAVRWGTQVILSTPCCHHEMFHEMNAPNLSFITEHSMLKQKLADAATDALRCLWLKKNGYDAQTMELIDPEETPKNLMIRAQKRKKKYSEQQLASFRAEYDSACRLLGCTPYLEKSEMKH